MKTYHVEIFIFNGVNHTWCRQQMLTSDTGSMALNYNSLNILKMALKRKTVYVFFNTDLELFF